MGVPAPEFDKSSNKISIPEYPGAEYRIDGQLVTGEVEIKKKTRVSLSAAQGRKLPADTDTDFVFSPEAKEEPQADPQKVEKAADAVVSSTAGNTPQAPGQDSGRAVSGGSIR